MAEARLAQRHERALLDPATPVSGLGVSDDLTRVADRLQKAGDNLVERRSFRTGDDLVTLFAQNSDGLRDDPAGVSDNDNLHGLPRLSTIQSCNPGEKSRGFPH